MKEMKRILVILSLCIALIFSTVVISACGKKEPSTNEISYTLPTNVDVGINCQYIPDIKLGEGVAILQMKALSLSGQLKILSGNYAFTPDEFGVYTITITFARNTNQKIDTYNLFSFR